MRRLILPALPGVFPFFPALGEETHRRDARPACGVLTVLAPVTVAGGGFSGLAVVPGTLLCPVAAGEGGYTLPVWRGETEAAAGGFAYAPFVPCREARPGDRIAGF